MGAVSVDLSKKERQLETKFPMHTQEGVEVFIKEYHKLQSSVQNDCDYDALIMLIDFDRALLESGLSTKEVIALSHLVLQDKKQVDVAEEMGVAKQTVKTWVNRATEKIANWYNLAEKEGDTGV